MEGRGERKEEDRAEVGQSAGEACPSQISPLLPAKNDSATAGKRGRSRRVNEVAKSGVMNYILPRAARQILKRK